MLNDLFRVLGTILLMVVLAGGVAVLGYGVWLLVAARAGSSEDVAVQVYGVFGAGALLVGLVVTAAAGSVAYLVARRER